MAVGNTIGKLTTEPMLPQSTPAGSGNPPEKKSWWSKWGDVVHTGLDILGAVPVIGIVADGANAAIYAAEGDYVNAAISGASAAANLIPGGGAAMKAGKAAVAVGKQAIKATAKEGAEALAKKAAAELAEKAAKEAAEKAAKEGAEAAGKKAAKKAGSDAGGGVKGKGKKAKTCTSKTCVLRPVNPILGVKFLDGADDLDFNLPAPMALPWQRSYFSDQIGNGWLGQGWSLPLSVRLLRRRDGLVLVDEQGREIELPEPEIGEQEFDRYEEILLAREANGRFRVSSSDGATHQIFAPLELDAGDPLGERASYLPLVAIEDRNGNRVRLIYDGSGLPAQVFDAAGRVLGLHFENLAVAADAFAPRLRAVALLRGEPLANGSWPRERIEMLAGYEYSAEGDLVRVRGGGGAVRREYIYNNHILVEHSVPGAVVARYEYDQYSPAGKVIRHTSNLGDAWQFTYLAGETIVSDSLGRQTRYRFNADADLIGVINPAGGHTRVEVNAWSKPTRVTDPAGKATRYHYDAEGNVAAIVDASGARTQFQFDERWALPTAITDPNGAVTRYAYDAAGNLIRETNALGHVTAYNHDERGLLVRLVDAHGGRQKLEYDNRGLLLAHTDCVGHATRYGWDDYGNPVSIEHADGGRTEYVYDQNRRLQQIVYPDGSRESYAYDAAGRMVATTDTGGQVTRWELAPDGLPVTRTDSLGHRFSYQYDVARRLVVLTDENGAFFRFAYDVNDNLIGEQGFDGRVTLYRYDAAGALLERRDLGLQPGPGVNLADDSIPELLRTQYLRDPAGNVIEKITGRARDKRVATSKYTYDAVGRVLSAINGSGHVHLAYDELGRLVGETTQSLGRSQTIEHRYDALDNRIESTLPDGRRVTQHYYGPGYLHRIELDGTLISEIERDVMQRETVRSQGALTSYFDYDAMGRRIGQRARKNGVSAPENIARRYVYDRAGNLQAMSDQRFGQVSYSYDAIGRVTRANAERFAFDPAHNLVEAAGQVVRGNRLAAYEDKRFVYDTHGNLVEKRVGGHTRLRLDYDPEHQLEAVQIERNGVAQQVSYGYDAFGRRCWKRDSFGLTHFCWDGNHLLQETRGDRCLTYLYEPDSSVPVAQLESLAVDAAARPDRPARVRYFHTDQIGAPRELTESDGSISWRANYRAWGNTLVVEYLEPAAAVALQGEPVHQPIRFEGQYFDAETGLHYNRFRYYDPDIGRFVSQDPISVWGGSNTYQYAPNAQGWIDPWGLARCPKASYPSWMKAKKGMERHHIIPYHLKDHPVFQSSGLNINAAHNMMYLPRKAGGAGTKTRHSYFRLGDCHHNKYDDYMQNVLDDVQRQAKTNKWDAQRLQKELMDIAKTSRRELNAGRKVWP
ncbi:RHS repeat-associated protein [Tahibacter aquaticus]|uniref:RHS repeat-associated protein n=1 Tax=Tahibacter aquaticus TaxID=520092 RepID=A0A4R6YVA1_9GAMM|nr:RHS repeat-associated core domain-containing protein [Tahibacter aquaticus]TDR42424.1 RHS repeat-associated protein [Tahibacter aquaticus]